MYFNKIAPIGISLRPWRVHQDAYTKRTRDIIAHDFTHIEDSSEFYDHSQYESVRRTYEYILHNQEALGPPGRVQGLICLLYTSPSPRDGLLSRMASSAWKKKKN